MLLANFVDNLTPIEQIGVSFWNQGTGRKESDCIGFVTIVYLLFVIMLQCFHSSSSLKIAAAVAAVFSIWPYLRSHSGETESKRNFDKAVAKMKEAETVFEALFPGYGLQKVITEKNMEQNRDIRVWSYLVDWTRKELLNVVVKIQKGDESMRGELRIKFRIAKNLFGDSIDNNQGFDPFFTGEIIEKMKNFQDEFARVIRS